MLMKIALALAVTISCQAQTMHPGRNPITIRGRSIDIYFIPASNRTPQPHPVLFAPGDGGWRGFAICMAQTMASWGYDVYAIDTKQYLERFTTDQGALKEAEVMSDMRTIADSVRGRSKLILAGWSEGAGLSLLAASGPGKDAFAGLAAIGLGEESVLGWRTVDNLTWITRRKPDEPSFRSRSYLPKVAPLRLAMLHATGDEYTGVDSVKRMFAAAAEPKRLHVIEARNHRFEGGRERFFETLHGALDWIATAGQ